MQDQHEKFDIFGILEIMGHNRFAGRITEQVLAGCSFIRIDVPEIDGRPAFTKLFGASSVYGITPTTEEVALMIAKQIRHTPVSVYDLPEEVKEKIRQPAIAHYGEDIEDPDSDLDDDDY